MNLIEAKEKYFNKIIAYKKMPYLFEIANVYPTDDGIVASFRHLYYRHVPLGQPVISTIRDLDENYRILG